jgi:2'-5' RNA ligase
MPRRVESAVAIAFAELSPVVDEWRERTCADRPSIGIPPHVTLLHPFVPTELVHDGIVEELGRLFAATPVFPVTFRELRQWPGMLYLAPEPPEPFTRLTAEITRRWPDYPPYEGIHEEVIPHLTVAYGDDALLAVVEADVVQRLPVNMRVREAILLEELVPDVRWVTRERFPLGGG